MKEMKWYIFDECDNSPLCWDKPCLEFDTKESAQRFLNSVAATAAIDTDYAVIKQCIFFYDDGYMNATNLICECNGDDIELKELVGDNNV